MCNWIVLFCYFSFISNSFIFGDSPPSWKEFRIESLKGKFIAEISSIDKKNEISSSDKKWILTIREKKSKRKIWSSDYYYDGYAEGRLDEDGSLFVYVNYWFSEKRPVVIVYEKDKPIKEILGSELNFDRKIITSGASHFVWLRTYSLKNKKLTITLLDNSNIIIEL
ncbi:MAG: hypothetical protein SFU98_02985 [Leptospiraceae bacterium]|nr:hypothetical protein [Leptospiraceae bacterium]